MYRSFFKRVIDILVSFIACIILLPVFIVLLIVMSIAHKGNPFFTQIRPGKSGKLFTLVKFKSMHDGRDLDGQLLPDYLRLTKAGKFLRKTSLDEMPQLLSVLVGNMSLIGPRPLLVDYLPLYNRAQARRHEVLPGITGWAQVNGRNTISWEQKFAYDVWYVDHISFQLDMKILWMTVKKVFQSSGVNASAEITMKKFIGTKDQSTV